jgi:hypothetical protein
MGRRPGTFLGQEGRHSGYTARDDTYGRRRVYLPAFAKEDDAVSFYSLQEGRYHPGFYGVKEQMNAIWYQPDFD